MRSLGSEFLTTYAALKVTCPRLRLELIKTHRLINKPLLQTWKKRESIGLVSNRSVSNVIRCHPNVALGCRCAANRDDEATAAGETRNGENSGISSLRMRVGIPVPVVVVMVPWYA